MENILILAGNMRLCDFGMAVKLKEGQKLKNVCDSCTKWLQRFWQGNHLLGWLLICGVWGFPICTGHRKISISRNPNSCYAQAHHHHKLFCALPPVKALLQNHCAITHNMSVPGKMIGP